MNALVATPRGHGAQAAPGDSARSAVVLLGTGVVGGAFLRLLNARPGRAVRLVGAANSRRQAVTGALLADRRVRERLNREGEPRDDHALLHALDASGAGNRILVDATASEALAEQHAAWLARGYHVVTANKAAAGSALVTWRKLQAAQDAGGRYGDAATVGAGLPVLSTLRRLRACGDVLLGLEGVFSGSLSWLFSRYDASVPFSSLLRKARELGYSEPDPRADLSGQDVARKLLILARSAGFALEPEDIEVENLVPEALRACPSEQFLARSHELDEAFAERHAQASRHGHVLRYLARLDRDGKARVNLAEVDPAHPAYPLRETDNLFALSTERYAARPLVIQGPGAGAEVTAQALLGDILMLAGG